MSHFYADRHLDRLHTSIDCLKHEIVRDRTRLQAVFAVTREPVPFADRLSLDYRPIAEGGHWGDLWDCGWFHITGRVPEGWTGHVVLDLGFGGEACVFDASGCPVYGLTNGSVFDQNYAKNLYPLLDDAKGGEPIDLWIETGCNGLFGANLGPDPAWEEDPAKRHGSYDGTLTSCRVCRLDYDKWQLWFDLVIAENLVRALPAGTARRMQVLRIASDAQSVLATRGPAAARERIAEIYALDPDPATPDVYAIGHAHIDTGWLWPVRETIRKCARTFASQIHNIERYPDFKFGASQAQLYEFTKKRYPALYAKIQKAVAEGRWEVQGGMWVEADCNIPSGESLVRQFLVGKNFFRDEFGVDVQNLWLPDVFGYSGNLPQILRRAGMGYFLTQKLSWNIYNKFPHNTFWWRGIDGSSVLAHFPPEDDYNSPNLPSSLRKHETNNSEAGLVQEAISLFGIGDGGGGPTETYIERGLRCRHLNGCPRLHFSFAQPALEKMASYGSALDTWDGELYFELHRGTYTSQAAMKRANRRAEEAFRATEMLCALAHSISKSESPKVAQSDSPGLSDSRTPGLSDSRTPGLSDSRTPGLSDYPSAELLNLWKRHLINQFHDIIPGSSIHRVYAEQVPRELAVAERLKALGASAAARLLAPAADAVTFFNPSSTAFAGALPLPEGWDGATDEAGAALPAQREGDGPALAAVRVPPLSFATLRKAPAASSERPAERAQPAESGRSVILENSRVRYAFDPATLRLIEAFDKETGRDLVAPGEPANRLELFEDVPHCYDAWDVEEYALDMRTAEAEVVSLRRVCGPVRQGLDAELRIGASTLRQRVRLEEGSKRLDFVTDADWREDHKLLRVAFPLALRSQEARFEIQYGNLARPTHDNTKWQHAQFEVLGHRFADLSERDAGAALLNDSKYGYRAKGHELSLSLLRAPTYPDADADRGPNHFVYAFLPHAGDLAASDVLAHAAVLNQGVERFEGLAAAAPAPLPARVASAVGGHVEYAVLKRAEKEDCLVLRLVELQGVRTTVRLETAPGLRLVETDLMEWNDLAEPDPAAPLVFEPFAMRTFKLRPVP